MTGCLDGVRVLELARFQAGPRGGMLLSDLGADVIKIEPPGGEETRRHPPMVRGQSVYFSVYNRGKRSLCVDLRHPRGKEVFAALVPKADVVLDAWYAARTVSEVCAALMEAGIPVAPVKTIPEVAQDPHLWQREMLAKMDDPIAGEMYLPGATIKLSKTPARVGPVPRPAQHTDDVLAGVLGYDRA